MRESPKERESCVGFTRTSTILNVQQVISHSNEQIGKISWAERERAGFAARNKTTLLEQHVNILSLLLLKRNFNQIKVKSLA